MLDIIDSDEESFEKADESSSRFLGINHTGAGFRRWGLVGCCGQFTSNNDFGSRAKGLQFVRLHPELDESSTQAKVLCQVRWRQHVLWFAKSTVAKRSLQTFVKHCDMRLVVDLQE